jgi:hypothetical protein
MTKVAILARSDNKSPKVLAYSLQSALRCIGVDSELFLDIGLLRRLNSLVKNYSRHYNPNPLYRFRQRITHLKQDRGLINRLKEFDAIILSECIPNAYWKDYYGIQKLKEKTGKKIGLYEVFFLDASPKYLEEIKEENPQYKGLYDFELAVSRISYTKIDCSSTKFEVGLNLNDINIKPTPKDKLIALIDFNYPGNESIREVQIASLRKLGIETIELTGTYSINDIRELYKRCSLLFLQHFESFGVPIAECLGYGAKIVTPFSNWPMAFRKDEYPIEYGPGILPDSFIVYNDQLDLENKLFEYKIAFDSRKTPFDNFNLFLDHYPHFYFGNTNEIKRFKEYLLNR